MLMATGSRMDREINGIFVLVALSVCVCVCVCVCPSACLSTLEKENGLSLELPTPKVVTDTVHSRLWARHALTLDLLDPLVRTIILTFILWSPRDVTMVIN